MDDEIVTVHFTVRTYSEGRSYAHAITLECDHGRYTRREWRGIKHLDFGGAMMLLQCAIRRPRNESFIGADRGLDLICEDEAHRYHWLNRVDIEIGGTLRARLRPRRDHSGEWTDPSRLTFARWASAVRATGVRPTGAKTLDCEWLFDRLSPRKTIRSHPLPPFQGAWDVSLADAAALAQAIERDIVREMFAGADQPTWTWLL